MLIFLISVLLLAVIFDTKNRRIPNWLTLSASVILLFWQGLHGSAQLFSGLLGLLIAGGVWFLLWQLGLMGGGDQKLMMVVGAFLGPDRSVVAIFAVALSGGLQALLWYLLHLQKYASWKNFLKNQSLPYSLAIAVGTGLVIILDYFNKLPPIF